MKVTALDGRAWTVRRRWAPKVARRFRERAGGHLRRVREVANAGDVADAASFFDELLPALAILVVTVVAIAFLVTGLPLLIDVVLVVLFGLGGALGRLLFRRPWTVEAVSGADRVERSAVGWRASSDAVGRLGDDLRHGRAP